MTSSAPDDADALDALLGAPPLLAASIRVTSRCNLSCRHCYVERPLEPDLHGRDRLGADDLFAIIDALRDLGCVKLFVTGGEPFLRPDIVHVLRHAHALGLGLAISTNGTVVSRGVLEALADLPFDLFQVSVDGPPGYHDGNRGLGSFAAARDVLTWLSELDFKNRTVGCTIGAANHRHLPDMVRIANELGATHLSVTLEIEGGPSVRQYAVHELAGSLAEFGRRMAAEGGALEMSRTSTIPIALVPRALIERFGAERFLMCSYPYTAGIDAEGNVAPCDGFFATRRSHLGNVLDGSLAAAWRGEEARAVRRHGNGPLGGVCGLCRHRQLCGGGCRANAVARSGGDHAAPDPVCQAFFEQGLFPAHELEAPANGETRT